MITIELLLPEYLAQWAVYRLDVKQEDGRNIIMPAKGSPLAHFLRNFLQHKNKRNKNLSPGEREKEGFSKVFINIPHFPGRDPQYFNYLSPTVEAQLRDLIRSRFDLQLFTDFSRFKNVSIQNSEFIHSWIDANGIDQSEKNWLAVDKRLQLLRRRACDRDRKSKKG